MADGDVPYRGPNLGPLQSQGAPAGSPWGVVKTEPVAAATSEAVAPVTGGWTPKTVEPAGDWTVKSTVAAPSGAGSLPSGANGPPVTAPSGGAAPKAVESQPNEGQTYFRKKGPGYDVSITDRDIDKGINIAMGSGTGLGIGDARHAFQGMATPGFIQSVAPQAVQAARNAMGTIEKIFSPETVDAPAQAAVSFIRDLYGQAAQHTAQTEQSIEKSWRTINAMPAQDRLNFIDYVEGRSTTHANTQLAPDIKDLADTLRRAFEQRMNKLQALPKHAQQGFVDDYFPHFWKDPSAAANLQPTQSAGVAGRQGSGASLKQRSVPTISDGIAAGLTPVTDNPLEATMRYVTSMDRFIASEAVMQTAKDQGYVRFIKPKVMGASGHPSSFKVPDGWAPLQGRGARDASGAQAYAPEGFARVYNNFVSRGVAEHGQEWGKMYDAARHATNAITGLELSASGYHFLTMAKAAIDNSLANAIRHLRGGKPIEALKQVAKTPLAPIRYARSGKQVKDVYLGISPGTLELQNTVEALTRAGGRAKGKSADYEFSKGGSFWTALKRGALKIQWMADRTEAKAGMAGLRSLGEARFVAKQFGRLMDTVAEPLFEHYIPAVKNGAFRENLATWLQHNPNASQAEIQHAARQLWDTIDDRFGEMVQDNIFMNKFGKQIGMLLLRSWSWTVGQDFRMLGGAVRDVARAPFKKVTGTGPNDTRWTQKMDQAIAMPIVYGTAAAIYQYLKTGKPPESLQDLKAPRTGGVDASTGEPERLMIPGPEKDVFGFMEHPITEGMNKLGTGPKQAGQLLMNEDFRGDPVYPEGEGVPAALKEIVKYLGSDLFPIIVKELWKGQKEGGNLNKVEKLMGVHPAPRYLTDPEGYEQMMRKIHGQKWEQKLRHDRKQRQLYGGDE